MHEDLKWLLFLLILFILTGQEELAATSEDTGQTNNEPLTHERGLLPCNVKLSTPSTTKKSVRSVPPREPLEGSGTARLEQNHFSHETSTHYRHLGSQTKEKV